MSTVTPCPIGPVPIRQKMSLSGRDLVPPNLFQLWVRKMEFLQPTRRIPVLMSSTRASIQHGIDFEGERASVKAFMFLLASLLPARFLRCLAQELLRMAIF